ncbi:MAG: AraC family transcriptional regulator [Planctomycetes bacterium]|nr:AraC family transcriptional regulator [Planctomycetota bacterium]
MSDEPLLTLREPVRLVPAFSGLFVSRGHGIHPRRTIDSWEIIYLIGGSLTMREGDRRFDLRAGQALLLQPGIEHAGVEPYSRDCRFYWVHFRRGGRDERAADAAELHVPQVSTLARPDALTALIRRYLDDQQSGRLTPAMGSHLIALMLIELALPNEAKAHDGAQRALARHAHELILTRFHERISTAGIARALKCNADYLGRCYRRVYGHGVVDAIHRRRLQRARELLLDSAQTIEAVATTCGFADALYFRRVFKRHQGMAPAAFRRMHSRLHMNTE